MSGNSFNDFLKHSHSQKEVSLVIAKDETEINSLVSNLEGVGFRQATDTFDLFNYLQRPAKVFFIVKGFLPKDLYDFILQYPTGQVEIYDKFNLKSQITSPNYKETSILFLITKEALKKTQETGFEILGNVGMAYQS